MKEIQLLDELRAVLKHGATYRDSFIEAGPLRDLCKGALELLNEITEPINRTQYRLQGPRDEIVLQEVRPGTKKPTLGEFYRDIDDRLRKL